MIYGKKLALVWYGLPQYQNMLVYCLATLGIEKPKYTLKTGLTVLDSVNSTIGDLDHLVESYERGLQRGQIDQYLDSFFVIVAQLLHLLTTSGQTGQIHGC